MFKTSSNKIASAAFCVAVFCVACFVGIMCYGMATDVRMNYPMGYSLTAGASLLLVVLYSIRPR